MSVKGLVTLDTKSSILLENLSTRILEGKRESCDIKFCDFDGVDFKISVDDETPNIVKVCMATPDWVNLSKYGTKSKIAKQYPGMETDPDEGYDMALEFDCDSLENPAKTLEDVANLRMHILTAPIDAAMDSLVNGSGGNGEIQQVNYRNDGKMFVIPKADRVVVIISIDFADETDRSISKVFLQEFVETQRTVRNATTPTVTFGKNPPTELSELGLGASANTVGYVLFSFLKSGMTDTSRARAVSLLSQFRVYLHYHIKASKTYLHMRMRKRVNMWMQVLNRAKPEYKDETKAGTKTASGKSFIKK
jgi:actin related protein 2/3 complex subunit 2